MTTKWIITIFCLFTLLAVAAGVVVSRHEFKAAPIPPATRHFQVNGIVRGLESDGQTILIQHEDIPGFMSAMTMPFSLHGTNAHGFAAGDSVRFELTVTKDDSWISQIVKLGTANEPSDNTVKQIGDNRIEIGEVIPDVALTDQNGKAFHLADFRGKAVLVTFIYTRCALPNYCPLMSKNFSELQQKLAKDFQGRFHLVSISFDSEYDTPQVMKSYAEAFTKDENSWTFASGSKPEILSVASRFGLIYLPEAGAFTHDLRTALIAPDGRLIHVWRSNVWTPDEVEQRVVEVLRQKPVLAATIEKHSAPDRQNN
jgi:protein SCO1/2